MKRTTAVMLAVLAVSVAAVADEPAGSGQQAPANAALQYWLAIGDMLPGPSYERSLKISYASGDAEIRKPLDDELVQAARSAESTIAFLRRGAQLSYCDWGLGHLKEEGPYALLPHADPARKLMRTALLHARYEFEHGSDENGVEDVIATMTLGRHMAHDPIFACRNSGHATEQVAEFVLAAYLPGIDAGALRSASTALDTLPTLPALDEVVLFERDMLLDWTINKLKQPASEKELLGIVHLFTGTVGKDAKEALTKAGGAAEGLRKQLTDLRPLYDEAAELMRLPVTDLKNPAVERFAEKIRANPLAEKLLGDYLYARRYAAQMDCRRAMLKAAIDVVLKGEDGLKDHLDPLGDGPFEYVAFDGGFELRSDFILVRRMKQRLTLTAGIRRD